MPKRGKATTNNPLVGIDYQETLFNPRWFMENMLKIVDKDSKLVDFKLNQEQATLLNHIEFCLANDLPVRIIVLKARQIGATTFFAGLGFWFTAMNINKMYGIVAHRLDSAESIFKKTKIFYNNLPTEIRPSTVQFSSETITFDKKDGTGINSQIKFATVNEGVFRGQTLGYLHESECAFWEGNVQAIENSLAPTVALKPWTIVVKESTARGYNHFKDDWDRAVKGISGFTPFFFGWHMHDEYRLPVPKDFVMTDRELQIKKAFNLDDEQVMWRRYQIETHYKGNEIWFQQENPMTPQEAFIASGASVFDSDSILEGYRLAKEPKRVSLKSYPTFEKLLVWKEAETRHEKIYQQKAYFDEEQQKYVYRDTDLLLEEHEYETPYTIGIDTSGMGADINQLVVINNITKEMVARYGKKNISEENLAKIAVEVARMYNDALIAPEVNYSHQICNFIIQEGYKNIYVTENTVRQDMKIVGGITYGFKTTRGTKPGIISELRSHLTSNPSLIPDKEFWEEAEYYIIEDVEKNITNAASGHHDDIVMATAIAMYVSSSFQSPQTRRVKKKETNEHFLLNTARQYHKKNKVALRKGIYTNHA